LIYFLIYILSNWCRKNEQRPTK